MIKICSMNDLQQVGMNCLTGEACPYAWRILFDLTERAAKAVSGCLSLRPDALTDNWNSKVGDEPAVKSVMLTPLQAHEFAPFLLLEYGCHTVLVLRRSGGNHYVGLEGDEKYDNRGHMAQLNCKSYEDQWVKNQVILEADGKEIGVNNWEVGRVICKPQPQPGVVTSDGYNNIHQMSGRGR